MAGSLGSKWKRKICAEREENAPRKISRVKHTLHTDSNEMKDVKEITIVGYPNSDRRKFIWWRMESMTGKWRLKLRKTKRLF